MYCVVREYLVHTSNFSEGKRSQKRRLLDIEGDLWIGIIDIHLRFKMECHYIRKNTIYVYFKFSFWCCFLLFSLCIIVYKTFAML
jgi:hypothetical protein